MVLPVQVLVLDDVTLSAGGRDLLSGASWRLLPAQRTGRVGFNGCGKSTRLRALVGKGEMHSGYVALSLDSEVAYLEQTCVLRPFLQSLENQHPYLFNNLTVWGSKQ